MKPVLHGRDHLPGHPDPIPGLLLPGASLEEIILATPDLAGFWPLNESSGDVAHDLSGNSYDLDSGASRTAPTWAQPAGPPGEQCAEFDASHGEGLSGFPGLTTDLTLEIWAKRNTTVFGFLIGQSSPLDVHASGVGIAITSPTFGTTGEENKPALFVNNTSTGPNRVVADNVLAVDTWVYLACTRLGSLCTLYVDGAAQSATMSPAYTAGSGMFIGMSAPTTVDHFEGDLSYAAAYSRALTASEIAAHFLAAGSGGSDPTEHMVLESDGAGGTRWADPTVEVEF